MENIYQAIFGPEGFERWLNGVVWGIPAMVLIFGTGIFLTLRCSAPQFLRFGHVIKNTIGKAFSKKDASSGSVSPFNAMCTALAASIGTGNIAGVSGAIAIGGPGAIFWMWVSALLGMCTKYAEVILAVKFRQRNDRGEWVGGPMYYIQNGLGKKWKWLAILFAIFGAIASFGIGNVSQINTIAGTINTAISGFAETSEKTQFIIALAVGIIGAALAFCILIGGINRIGNVATAIVPIMATLYVFFALILIVVRVKEVPAAFASIVTGAFKPVAVAGGLAGVGIKTAMTKGVGRGIFSNEAGLGSAPIAHAAADVDHPVQQGIMGIFEVFMDTIVVCTMTALVILVGIGPQNIAYGTDVGANLTIQGFMSVFGTKFPGVFVAVCLTLFAFSTIMAWALYGSRCAEYLLGTKVIKPYMVIFCLAMIVGAVSKLDVVWNISDTMNGLMAIPNLVGLLLLSPVVVKLSREYFAQVKKEKK